MKGRSGLRTAIYLLFFLLVTVVLILVNFPMEKVTDRINEELGTASGNKTSVKSAHFSLPLSLVLTDVTLSVNGEQLNVGDARVTPHLLSLLDSSRGANVAFVGPWGKLPMSVVTDGGGWSLEGGSDKIQISLLPGFEDLPVDIAGDLSINGDLNYLPEGQGSLSGRINLRLKEAV
ncbi:type II secretion system protein GspN, partial [bacterium]